MTWRVLCFPSTVLRFHEIQELPIIFGTLRCRAIILVTFRVTSHRHAIQFFGMAFFLDLYRMNGLDKMPLVKKAPKQYFEKKGPRRAWARQANSQGHGRWGHMRDLAAGNV